MASLTVSINIKRNIISSKVLQNITAQDVALSGSTDEFDWLLVADGHGGNSNRHAIKNLFNEIDWGELLTNPDFFKDDKDEDDNYKNELYSKIYELAGKDDPNYSNLVAFGTTLSIVKIYDDRFECYHIGDSTIKIYENDKDDIEKYTKRMESDDHNTMHSDMETLKLRTGGGGHACRSNWFHKFEPIPNGVRTDNVFAPLVLDEKTVTMRQSAYVSFDDGSVVNMTRSLGHIPSKGMVARAKQNNHAMSLAQQSLTKVIIPRNPNINYCILAATDGLWDMAYDGDDTFFTKTISEEGVEAAEKIATFARERWLQEWNYCFRNLTEKITQSERHIDDVGVSCAFITSIA